MKNLKRALSFALASVMLVGMMVVGAGAADFGDKDKIQNTDAVNTLVALGVLKGKDTGNFDPEGIVTRAEMAKMICVAMNGGTDPKLAGGVLFPDTKNHWASGYIDYCANLGIVAGDTAGNFNPDKTVTGTEAAKMILTAIGFTAENEKFVNDANWATNINVRASQKGLYENLAILPTAGLSRDNAAQMIWNGLNAPMVKYTYQLNTVNGNLVSVAIAEDKMVGNPATTINILQDKFKMDTEFGFMTHVSYDSKKAEYTYTMDNGSTFGLNAADQITTNFVGATLKSDKDFSAMVNNKVKVLSKTVNSKTTVYGMYPVDTAVLYTGVGNDLPGTIAATDESVKLDGTNYKLTKTAAGTKVYAYNDTTSTGNLNAGLARELAFKLVDITGDGEGDLVITYPVTVAKVTFVGKDSITVGGKSYKFEDASIYEGVAKNDYAVITLGANTPKNTPVVAKAEIVSGDIEATRTGEVKLAGTWYTDATAKAGDAYKIGNAFELVVVNGFVFNAKQTTTTASAKDAVYALLVDIGAGTGTKLGTQGAQLLFADGSKKIVTVDKVDTDAAGTLAAPAGTNLVKADTVYTYAIDKDGNYELTQIKNGDYDTAVTSASTKGITIADGKATSTNFTATLRFNDDAVVFVKGNNGVKALTGADINKWGTTSTTSTGTENKLYANAKNGFSYVNLGVLAVSGNVPGAAGDTSYGWITGTPSLVKSGDDYYIEVSLWNGTEEVTVLAESTASLASITSSTTNANVAGDTNIQKGTPVSYKDLGSNKVSTVTTLATSATAITGYAGGKDIEFLAPVGAGEIKDDTVIVYVNTADNKGVVGGELAMADKDALGNYIKNAYAAVDGTKKVTYIIIDVANNNLAVNSSAKAITAIKDDSAAALTINEAAKTISLNSKTVTLKDGKLSTTGNITLSAGADYTITSASATALAVDDTILVVAANGSAVTYTVVA